MTNKLPDFFEELINTKFAETNKKIDDLKLHVNDELFDLKKMAKDNHDNIMKIWLVVILLIAYHVLLEDGKSLLSLITSFV